jgi:serine protease Do
MKTGNLLQIGKRLAALAFMLLCATAMLQAQTQPAPPAAPPAIAPQPAPPAAPSQEAAPPAFSLLLEGRNFLGILPGEVTRENMGRYALREPRGVAVTKVLEGSPAARAGLKEGDVILRFDGETVGSVQKLNRLINEAAPEQTVRLSISRQGSEQELSATLARRSDFPTMGALQGALPRIEALPALPGVDSLRGVMPTMPIMPALPNGDSMRLTLGASRRIGVATTQLTKQLADYFGVTTGRGLLVTEVGEGSPAARAGLKAGDVITEVDGQAVGTVSELMRALNSRQTGEVSLTIMRDKHQRTIRATPERREVMPFNEMGDFYMPEGRISIPRMNLAIPRNALPQIRSFKLAPRSQRPL